MKRNYVLILCVLFFTSCVSSSDKNISGVWLLNGKGNLNFVADYSWGKNPSYNQAIVIDLGAKKPYIDTGWGRFYVSKFSNSEKRFVFHGIWAEGENGDITVIFLEQDKMYFEKTIPEGRAEIGPSNVFYRVPVDARVQPIDPDEGP